MVRPTDKEINGLIGEIIENPGPRFPGMTYEEGVRDALEWVLGNQPNPLEE